MKGFWRALRRGEEWAVRIDKLKGVARAMAFYLPDHLLMEELLKRDYFLLSVEKDDAWQGATLVLPVQGPFNILRES